ncbi:MAG: hypothetical protein K8R21_11380 [Leptospira sp.]|nr:hypothetical protein [Leptospira sp.]
MRTIDLLMKIGALYHLGFAIFHVFFWKIFNWKSDLRKVSIASRAIIQIANLCLILFFLMVAWISGFHSEELISTRIGNSFLVFVTIFWIARFIEQLIFLGMNNTFVNVLSLLFILGIVLYGIPVISIYLYYF